MQILQIIEVGIGIALIYLLFSLLATSTAEALAGLLDSRARTLRLLISGLLKGSNAGEDAKTQVAKLYAHPLIKAVTASGLLGRNPSYLSGDTLLASVIAEYRDRSLADQVVMHVESIKSAIDGLPADSPIRFILQEAWRRCEERGEDFQRQFDRWYEEFENRVKGYYRQQTQAVLLVLSVLIAGSLNVDTIAIVRQLSSDPSARVAAVKQAEAVLSEMQKHEPNAKKPDLPATGKPGSAAVPGAPKESTPAGSGVSMADAELSMNLDLLRASGLPLGWDQWQPRRDGAHGIAAWQYIEKAIGILLTALAMMLGAPFWFDMLKRLFEVRSVGLSILERTSRRSGK